MDKYGIIENDGALF